jgi:uncharacterized protein
MDLPQQSKLVRIFVGESTKHNHLPLYEAIVLKAREMHLAGATVTRCVMGFGKSSRLHTTKILRLSDDLPMLVEIVDSEEKVTPFLRELDTMMPAGLVTVEDVQAHAYRGVPPAR